MENRLYFFGKETVKDVSECAYKYYSRESEFNNIQIIIFIFLVIRNEYICKNNKMF